MIDVKAIRARADKATPGPWAYYERGCREFGYDLTLPSGIRGAYEQEEDVAFIAHARDDVPALLDALDAANARAERLAAYARNVRTVLEQTEIVPGGFLLCSGDFDWLMQESLTLQEFGDLGEQP